MISTQLLTLIASSTKKQKRKEKIYIICLAHTHLEQMEYNICINKIPFSLNQTEWQRIK